MEYYQRGASSDSRHACSNAITNCTAVGGDPGVLYSHDTTLSNDGRHRPSSSIAPPNSSAADDGDTKISSGNAACGHKRKISEDKANEATLVDSCVQHTGIDNKKLRQLNEEEIKLIWKRLISLPTREQFMDELNQLSFALLEDIGYELDCYQGWYGWGQGEQAPDERLRSRLEELYLEHKYVGDHHVGDEKVEEVEQEEDAVMSDKSIDVRCQELAKSITHDDEKALLPHLLYHLCGGSGDGDGSSADCSLIYSIVRNSIFSQRDTTGVAQRRSSQIPPS